ncbi:MAG: hypothetical protein QI197_06520 [Candidatus Korarchaeota archaeon]|nr:hypothetical protein [Candidatus Korarchaeota archaeon]
MKKLACPQVWPAPWAGWPLVLSILANSSISAAIPLGFGALILGEDKIAVLSLVLMVTGTVILFISRGRRVEISDRSMILVYGILKKEVKFSDIGELMSGGDLSGLHLARALPGLTMSVAISTLSGCWALYWSLTRVWHTPLAAIASLAGGISLQYFMIISIISPSGGRRFGYGHVLGTSAGAVTLALSSISPDGVKLILILMGGSSLILSLAFSVSPSRMRGIVLMRSVDGKAYPLIAQDSVKLMEELARILRNLGESFRSEGGD